MSDLVEQGLLESAEAITQVGAGSAVVNCVAGQTYSAGDIAIVYWGTDPDDLTENFTEGIELDGLELGDAFTGTIDGIDPNTRVYYRVQITKGGQAHLGEVRSFWTTTDVDSQVEFLVIANMRLLEAINQGHANRLALIDRTIANMSARHGAGLRCTRLLSLSNDWPTAKFPTGSTIFPIAADGSSSSPTSPFALSQTDTDRDCRLARKRLGDLLSGAPLLMTPGRRNGEQSWHLSANNGGANNVAAHSRTSLLKYFGNEDVAGDWVGDADAKYGARICGPVLVCVGNPHTGTTLSESDPADAPEYPDDPADVTMDDAQWNLFFDSADGAARTADPAATPFVLYLFPGVFGGAMGAAVGLGGKRYTVDKAAIAANPTHEHGAGSGWPNDYGYTGEHSTLGVHRAIVQSMKETGTQAVVLLGENGFFGREIIDGVLYVSVPPPADSEADPYGFGNAEAAGFGTPGAWLDTEPTSRYMSGAGHLVIRASKLDFALEYVRAYVPGLTYNGGPVAEPADAICLNNTVVDRFVISVGDQLRARVIDSFRRIPDDTTVRQNAGTTQPASADGEPDRATMSEDGGRWNHYSETADVAAEQHFQAVRASIIDGAHTCQSRRPVTAGHDVVIQTISRGVYGLNRIVKWNARNHNAASPDTYMVGICVKAKALSRQHVSDKGLYLRVRGATSAGADLRLHWDNGTTDTFIGTASPDYGVPENAPFGIGVMVIVRGRQIKVYADNGSGVYTLRITHLLSEARYAQLRQDRLYWHAGWSKETDNRAPAPPDPNPGGWIAEAADFKVIGLPQ